MRTVSIYEIKCGDIKCQYGNDFSEIKNAKRGLHTVVSEEDYNLIVNGGLEEVKQKCRSLLLNT